VRPSLPSARQRASVSPPPHASAGRAWCPGGGGEGGDDGGGGGGVCMCVSACLRMDPWFQGILIIV